MGSGNSKSQNSPSISHVSLQSTEEEEPPFVERSAAATELLGQVVDAQDKSKLEDWQEKFELQLNTVKRVFLINECLAVDEQQSKLIDRTLCDLVAVIEKLAVEHPDGWQPECENLCQILCSHVSAPAVPGKIPDITVTNLVQLNLVNVRVKSQQGLSGIMTLLQKNKSLETLELGFTGMKADIFQQAFAHIVKLQNLTYLGLRGNRLNNSAVTMVQKSLQSNKTLPHLMWVDFANNKDIITVPVTFLNLLKQRWPSHQYQPSFQELLDNKVVVQKSQFVLLV